jgi:hypothetical protein
VFLRAEARVPELSRLLHYAERAIRAVPEARTPHDPRSAAAGRSRSISLWPAVVGERIEHVVRGISRRPWLLLAAEQAVEIGVGLWCQGRPRVGALIGRETRWMWARCSLAMMLGRRSLRELEAVRVRRRRRYG